MYRTLLQLAHERSSEKRIELLRCLTDLYLGGSEGHTGAEAYLFNEVVGKIVDSVERDAKIRISASLASMPECPREVVRKLADDEDVDVARPVIRGSSALTDGDLIEIAQRASQTHLHAIAARASLSEIVTDVLIDRGGREVVHTVSANHGARFSSYGMKQLLARAAADSDLCEILVERPDLSSETVDKLLPLVSEQLAIRLVEGGHDVRGMLSAQMIERLRQRVTSALRDRQTEVRQTDFYAEQVRSGALTLDQAVQQLASSERLPDVAALLSEVAHFERKYMFDLIANGQLQAVMILFCSLELTWDTLDRILALRAAKTGAASSTSDELKRDYEAMDPALAQRVIRFLKVRRAASAQESPAA
jgi:uncharacterized protein (DUF2336 family)